MWDTLNRDSNSCNCQRRGTARRQAQAEHKADVLAEESASLILELDARPTAKQYKSLQCQLDILERRLDESKAEAHMCAFQNGFP